MSMRSAANGPAVETPNIATPSLANIPSPSGGGAGEGAVVAERLTKTFDVRPILRRVSFSLAAGQRLALLGPNGAGKTTLLRILATLAQPTDGRVVVAGCDLEDDASEARWRIGYVGHQTGLYDELTARENLLFFARMFGLRDGAGRADALLARVGLRARANDRVAKFSRGQAQRLTLARAILHEPEVLLLDEPDTGLDEDALSLLTELLTERAEAGQTSLFTTHQLARGLAQSDRALILVGGRIVYDGPSVALDVAEVRAYYAGKTDDTADDEYADEYESVEYADDDEPDDEGGTG
jgi:heme ABC exporter ATP-binding subunit CcmA